MCIIKLEGSDCIDYLSTDHKFIGRKIVLCYNVLICVGLSTLKATGEVKDRKSTKKCFLRRH